MYKFKHVDCFPVKATIDDHFKDMLRQCISYYYFSKLEKKDKLLDRLIKKWEMLWFTPELEALYSREELEKYSNKAFFKLRDFYKYKSRENTLPIAVNFGYEAIFEGSKNIHINGKIDLIKVVNDGTRKRETDIEFFYYSKNTPSQFLSKIDLNITLASYAFRKSFGVSETKIEISVVGTDRKEITMRSGSDFGRAKKAVYNIAEGIENRTFYPSDNRLNCSKCGYRTFCVNERAMEDK